MKKINYKVSLGLKLGDPNKDAREVIMYWQKEWSAPTAYTQALSVVKH